MLDDLRELKRVTKPAQDPQAIPEARSAAVNFRFADSIRELPRVASAPPVLTSKGFYRDS
jgi:hypothetical protein